jgi:pimeloyl-ACP methyl ester carboxylesterase
MALISPAIHRPNQPRHVAEHITLVREPAVFKDMPTPYEKPVLIITGRHDSITGYADPFTLTSVFRRTTYVTLDRAGHGVQIEQPAFVQALISEWLRRVAEYMG